MRVTRCPVPQEALLQRYVGQGATYTDCFEAVVPAQVTLAQFVSAFYTTRLFRAERFMLSLALRRRITDADVRELLSQECSDFAAWTIEARSDDELLMCDMTGHTRSWFAAYRCAQKGTGICFGSAVVAKPDRPLSRVVQILLPVHVLYSRALLGSALARLKTVT